VAIPIKPIQQFVEELAVRTIPDLAERGTAALPKILERAQAAAPIIGERAPNVPFAGTPATRALARSTKTEAPLPVRMADVVDNVKNWLAGFFKAEPGLPKDLAGKFYNTRVRVGAAQDNVDILLRDKVFKHLQRDPVNQVNTLADYMILADEFSNLAQKSAKTGLPPTKITGRGGVTLAEIKNSLAQVQSVASADPEVMAAHKALRKELDDTFDDMVQRGYISLKRRRADYTPIQIITEIAEGLSTSGNQNVVPGVLDSMMSRVGSKGPRETNIIDIARSHLGEYARKVAEDDLVVDLLNDPTINFTGKFQHGDVIPRGLSTYVPGPGMPGYGVKSQAGNFMAGVQAGLTPNSQTYMGGFVVPTKIANKLTAFKPRTATGGENALYRIGQAWARQMTLYNPANTTLNALSDYPMALLGEPGKPSRALGILRSTPQAIKEVSDALFGKGSRYYDLLRQEGGASATLLTDVGGAPVSQDFARFSPQAKAGLKERFKQARQFVEAVPRMAAGLEALQRTGSTAEFGRAARISSLPYGAGAPANARHPVARFIAPFMQFMGLATNRVVEMVGTNGSRSRVLAGLMSVPTATMMWNTRNEEFQRVEDSLPEYERDQMHAIISDPTDPEKPALDRNGKPIVMRLRYWVPEEVMNFMGLGNLPTRVQRMVRGRETVGEFAQSVPTKVAKNVAGQLGPLTLAMEAALQRSVTTGQPKPISETLRSMLPMERIALEGARGFEQAGPGEAAKRVAETALGASFANTTRKGKAVLDADLMEANRGVKDAKAELRRFLIRGDKARAREAREKLDHALERMKRVAEALKQERE